MIEVHLYGKLRRFTDNQDPTCDSIVYIPAEYHSLQRLTRQRERLMKSITIRKNRIGSIINGYLPDLRKAFSDEWSERARLFYRQRLNPFTVVRDGKSALETFLVSVKAKDALTESHRVYQACQKLAEFYEK